nr:cyclophilin-like fold protein [uncultured Carboxylicivirga sp.]
MKIKITINNNEFTGTLNDSEAAKDFASLFPMTTKLNDYARTEKVCDLSKRLSTAGSPSGCSAKTGDITCYSPWGNLAIFYKSFGYAQGLINLGKIDGDMKQFASACEKGEATFELID